MILLKVLIGAVIGFFIVFMMGVFVFYTIDFGSLSEHDRVSLMFFSVLGAMLGAGAIGMNEV